MLQSLATPRLHLRPLIPSDRDAIFALRSNQLVAKYIDRDLQTDINEAEKFIAAIINGYANGNTYYWALSLGTSDALIGTICLWNLSADGKSAEVGYELLPGYHGNGYMKEALNAICSFGFSVLQLATIYAHTHRHNTPSSRLLQTNHFVRCPAADNPAEPDILAYQKVAPDSGHHP